MSGDCAGDGGADWNTPPSGSSPKNCPPDEGVGATAGVEGDGVSGAAAGVEGLGTGSEATGVCKKPPPLDAEAAGDEVVTTKVVVTCGAGVVETAAGDETA